MTIYITIYNHLTANFLLFKMTALKFDFYFDLEELVIHDPVCA